MHARPCNGHHSRRCKQFRSDTREACQACTDHQVVRLVGGCCRLDRQGETRSQARTGHGDRATAGPGPIQGQSEYRTAVGPAAVHVHEDEFFYVIDGSGTLVTGGKLVHPKQTNAENLSGDSIEGGTAVTVTKGDFIVVPENTPHWFSRVNGHVTDMSLHVPGSKGQ